MLSRITKYSIKNILRNTFLSLSSILVLTLLMFFINILVIMHSVSFNIIEGINSKLSFSLYMNEDYNRTSLEVIDFVKDMENVSDNINIEYKTKEIILDELRERHADLAKIVEKNNPLPDTIVVSGVNLDQYEGLNNMIESRAFLFIKDEENSDFFANYDSQYKQIDEVTSLLHIVRTGLYVIISIFVLSIVVIIYSIIGNFIYYYKDEIYITRLVGGSKEFIYGPFVVQGALYSLAAFFVSFFIFMFLLNTWNNYYSDIQVFQFHYALFLGEMFFFMIIGAIGGYFSSKRYLK